MIQKGAGITEAFEATGVFTKTAISRFHSGAETGTVKNTALQLAEYYEKETTYKMKNAIDYHPADDLDDHHDRADGPDDRLVGDGDDQAEEPGA